MQWLTAGSTELGDINVVRVHFLFFPFFCPFFFLFLFRQVLFFEMNEPVNFKTGSGLPALISLHRRWGEGGAEADKIKRTFRAFAVSTCLGDWEVNNLRRTKEWLEDGVTKGQVHDEFGSRVLTLEHPKNLPIGMDVVERRTRNRAKLTKEAEKLLYEQPWQHDHNLDPSHTVKVLTNYLTSKPFYGKCAQANDVTQNTPTFLIFDKDRNVLWRFVGNCLEVHIRDTILPWLMDIKKPQPLITEEFRQAALAAYRNTKKLPPGAHVGKVVAHHDGKVNLDAPKEEKKDEAPAEEKK